MVLTPQRFHEHDEHRDFFLKHFLVKGLDSLDLSEVHRSDTLLDKKVVWVGRYVTLARRQTPA